MAVECLFRIVVGVRQRRERLGWHWGVLVRCLVRVVTFLAGLLKKECDDDTNNVRECAQVILQLLDYMVCYGDCFMDTPIIYDMLFYEILRNEEVLCRVGNNVFQGTPESFSNIRKITQYYVPLFKEKARDDWSNFSQVLREGYSGLNLVLVRSEPDLRAVRVGVVWWKGLVRVVVDEVRKWMAYC